MVIAVLAIVTGVVLGAVQLVRWSERETERALAQAAALRPRR